MKTALKTGISGTNRIHCRFLALSVGGWLRSLFHHAIYCWWELFFLTPIGNYQKYWRHRWMAHVLTGGCQVLRWAGLCFLLNYLKKNVKFKLSNIQKQYETLTSTGDEYRPVKLDLVVQGVIPSKAAQDSPFIFDRNLNYKFAVSQFSFFDPTLFCSLPGSIEQFRTTHKTARLWFSALQEK